MKDVTMRDWGAFVVSIILLGMFGYMLWHVLEFSVSKDDTMTPALLQVLQSLVTLVAGYWIGSSSSSRSKDLAMNNDLNNNGHNAAPHAPAVVPALLAAFVALAVLLATYGHAEARQAKHFPFPVPIPAPAPSPSGTSAVELQGIIQNKASILETLSAIDAADRQPIPGSNPPQMWDPISHMCIAGIGTEGQPGYIPGLALFISNLGGLATPPQITSFGSDISPVNPIVVFAQTRLALIAGQLDINNILTTGLPLSLRQSCGSLIQDSLQHVTSLAGLIALIVPK